MSGHSSKALVVLLLFWQVVSGGIGAVRGGEVGVADHLVLTRVVETPFLIVLKSSDAPPYQVTIASEDGRKRSVFIEIGKSFYPGDRFVAIKFEKKEEVNRDGNKRDVSELTVQDKLRKNQLTLVLNVVQDLAEPEVEFEWRGKTTETIKVKRGETFRIPGQDDATYRLMEVKDAATIVRLQPDGTAGEKIIVKRR